MKKNLYFYFIIILFMGCGNQADQRIELIIKDQKGAPITGVYLAGCLVNLFNCSNSNHKGELVITPKVLMTNDAFSKYKDMGFDLYLPNQNRKIIFLESSNKN